MINSVGGQIFQDSWNIGCKHTLNNEKQHQLQKEKKVVRIIIFLFVSWNCEVQLYEIHNGYHAITPTLGSVDQENTLPRVYRIPRWKLSERLKDGSLTRIQESKAISPFIQYLQNSLFS